MGIQSIWFYTNCWVFLNNLNVISDKWPLAPKNTITFWLKGTDNIEGSTVVSFFRLTTTTGDCGIIGDRLYAIFYIESNNKIEIT